MILKEVGLEKIQTLQNFKRHWLRSISAGTTRRWAIYDIFNKDLLIQSKEPQFKRQYMDLVLLPEIINEEEEYEIEEVQNHRK